MIHGNGLRLRFLAGVNCSWVTLYLFHGVEYCTFSILGMVASKILDNQELPDSLESRELYTEAWLR